MYVAESGEAAKEAVQDVAAAVKRLQNSVHLNALHPAQTKLEEGMQVISSHASSVDHAAFGPASVNTHATPSMPSIKFSFVGRNSETR